MSDRVVSEDPFMLIYCPDRCKTQDCLAALTFVPDWFVTIKMFEKYHDALLANDDILFFEEDFSKVTFFANEMGILGVDLDKTNLDDDNNFYEDYSETVFHVRLLACHNKFESRKTLKKVKVMWYPTR